MFEYPRQPRRYAPFVGPIADHQNQPPGRRWRWESALQRRFIYNVFPGTRVRAAAEPAFTPIREPGPFDGYRRELLRNPPGLTPARAMDALFTPSENVWDRSWLYCDHVIAGLHIKGLLHGQRRRNGNSDVPFNNLVTSNAAGFVRLTPVLQTSAGSSAPGPLMMGEPDPAFHNRLLGPAEFQIGDHVIFWNSILYPIVATGEWQLENALVVELDSDPERLAINLASLKLQGHGTVALTIGQYENAIGGHLREGMNDARNAAAAAPAGVDVLPLHNRPAVLVRWSPFGDPWSPPGPWWVRVVVSPGQTHVVLRQRLRGGVIPDGSYPVAPPFNDCVYYPLYRPQFQNGWDGYIAARRSGPVRVSRRLAPVPVDGSLIPGLHYVGGAWDRLPVVRPKPIP